MADRQMTFRYGYEGSYVAALLLSKQGAMECNYDN